MKIRIDQHMGDSLCAPVNSNTYARAGNLRRSNEKTRTSASKRLFLDPTRAISKVELQLDRCTYPTFAFLNRVEKNFHLDQQMLQSTYLIPQPDDMVRQ